MNTNIINNYSKLKLSLFFLPVFFLLSILLFLYYQDALCSDKYIQIQKDSFFFINYNLGQYPSVLFNFTQLGNALIFLSFLSVFIVYAPVIWESLISGLIVSFIFSYFLKQIFAVPRPAAVFNNDSFIVIGEKLSGHNSSPSGHSITVFAILAVLLFAFKPKKLKFKIVYFFLMIIVGLILVFTRVGVGAHYPFDVILGGIIGYISGLLGIFISRKYKIWNWISNEKYYPIFILLFLICCVSLINKIITENLLIFYFAFISLVVSKYKIIRFYVTK